MAVSKQSTYKNINVICTVLFCAFTFCYLYFFQGDMLAYTQHVLSDGLTTYRPIIGALIVTFVMLLISLATSWLTRKRLYFLSALYHLPSALIVACLTNIHVVEWEGCSVIGNAWIWCTVVFCFFAFFCQILKNFILPPAVSSTLMQLKNLVVNLILLFVIGLFVVVCGNTDEKAHLSLHVEQLLKDNRYSAAANIGKKQRYCDEHLLTLRAYSMAKSNQLGERFFENSIKSSSECLLPSKENPMLVFPAERIYKMLGGVKPEDMPVKEYLRLLHKRHQLKEGGRDYLYISDLLDGDIDSFAKHYAERYDSTTVVPKHYREALTLYNHLRAHPVIDFAVPEMEADYADFQAIVRKNPDRTKRLNALRDNYGNTYWYYFSLISF